MAAHIPTVSIDDLRRFHATHFPRTPIPENFLEGAEADATLQQFYVDEEDDQLGYYPDGVKRTLTDEDIAFLRRSEIRTILRERRRRRDEADDASRVDSDTKASSPTSHAHLTAIDPPSSDRSTSFAQTQPLLPVAEGADKVRAGRVEKPQAQQWTVTGAKTKARNAKNRKKNRLNHRARKKEEIKKKKKRDQKRQEDQSEDEESDEWDPWHQANGPDAQKDSTVDLDY